MYQNYVVVGHLGRDPEMRFTSSGQAVTNFSVATTRKWTNKDGEPQEKTTWIRVSTWGKLAELCNQYLSKGRLVLVEGDAEASGYLDKQGKPAASLELTARNVRFLGGNGGNGNNVDVESIGGGEEEEMPF